MITPDLSGREFKLFQNFILENSGIFLDTNREDSLRISLFSRITAKGFRNYSEYYSFLKYDALGEKEFKELLSLITINETYFFRNPSHFKFLKEYVLTPSISEKILYGEGIKIWSAGCSTGEEPYSMAITILEVFGSYKNLNIEVLATDVSMNALDKAKKGIYSPHSLKLVDEKIKDKYFVLVDKIRFKLKDEVKEMVKFEYFNLIKEPYPLTQMGAWDIIFCRNVTIYFKVESIIRVVHNFYNSLKDNGYFFIGYAETMQQISPEFLPFKWKDIFIYKKGVRDLSPAEKTVNKKETVIVKKKIERKVLNEAILARDLYGKAMGFFEQGDFSQALIEVGEVLKIEPQMAEAHFLAGKIHANSHRFIEAVEACQWAIQLVPLFLAAHFLLGVVYDKMGQRQEAIDEFRKVIYIDRAFGLAYFNIARIYQLQGESEKSLKEYTNAIKIFQKTSFSEKALEFSEGITGEFLIQTCRQSIEKIRKSINKKNE
ncbi:tetratricopeptide repeat protein [bacterium]|nr:tetratricopeptide repeat protein [bacterium]